MKKEQSRKGYMCGIDFQEELRLGACDIIVYPTLEDFKKHRKCWKTCGIVEVDIKVSKWVEPQDPKIS